MTPIYKKKGLNIEAKNYRGITVLPTICKVLETIIKNRIQSNILKVQNNAQRGFTSGCSPLNAAFIVEEFYRESKDNNVPAHLILLDAKAAFDVVQHTHMLRRLYHCGVQDKHWTLIESLHTSAASVVKWDGQLSLPFEISQGIRQGGILSTDLYKLYQNPLLNTLQSSGLGARIGDIVCNASACADDLALNSNNNEDTQVLIDIAVDYSDREQYKLQPLKSVSLNIYPTSFQENKASPVKFKLKDTEMPCVKSGAHLGMKRCSTVRENTVENVEENIKKATRTVYSLIPSGLHGHNGLDPVTSIHLYKTYVLPVLLYGMELLVPKGSCLERLELFQKKFLKRILSLPPNTADVAVYLLSGLLPVEARIHLKVLIFFNNICNQSEDSIEKRLARRQCAVKSNKSNSWFIEVKRILWTYDFDDIETYLDNPVEKFSWKSSVNTAIFSYWSEKLQTLKSLYGSLIYMNSDFVRLGKLHPVLQNSSGSARENTRFPVKLKIITGSYILQTNRAKFNGNEISSTCLLCGTDAETVEHFILICPVLDDVRNPVLNQLIKELSEIVHTEWSNLTAVQRVQIIIDSSVLLGAGRIRLKDLAGIEYQSRRLLYVLHTHRFRLLKSVANRSNKADTNTPV